MRSRRWAELAPVLALLWLGAHASEAGAQPASPELDAGDLRSDLVAVEPLPDIRRVVERRWTRLDGLPQSSATTVVTDEEGFVWVGTHGGLARFDGISFRTWGPLEGLEHPRITALAPSAEGGLWIGHPEGRVSRLLRSGEIRRLEPPPPLEGTVDGLLEPRPGQLFAWSREGLAHRVEGSWTRRVGNLRRVVLDPAGGLWIGTEHRLTLERSGRRTREVAVDELRGLALGPEGRPWILDARGLALLDGDRLRRVVGFRHRRDRLVGPTFTPDGAVWFALGPAVLRLTRPQRFVGRPEAGRAALERRSLPGLARDLLADSRGTVWLGLASMGLLRIDPVPFELVELPRGRKLEPVQGVVPARAGGLWVGVGCQGAARITETKVVERAFPARCVAGLAELDDGTLIATAGPLLVRAPSGEEREVPTPLSGPELLLAEPDGRILLADRFGRLAFWSRSGLVELEGVPLDERARVAARAPDGALWVGGRGRIAIRPPRGAWRVLDRSNGMPRGAIRAIAFDGHDVWIGSYGGGLARLRSGAAPRAFGLAEGLPSAFVTAIVPGPDALWMNGNDGAFRVERTDFDRVARGDAMRVGAWRIRSPESEYGRPSFLLSEGRISFPTIRGLVQLPFDAEPDPSEPPSKVRVERATVDAVPLDPQGPNDHLREGPGRLHVELATPRLDRSRLYVFEHRLDDGPWVSTSEASVTFERLPPGRHRFEVRASSGGGAWGPVARLELRLPVPLVETSAFRLGILFAVAVFLAGAATWRARVLAARHVADPSPAPTLTVPLPAPGRAAPLGAFARGVAHHLNNLLTVVQGQGRLAVESLEDGAVDEAREGLNAILLRTEPTERLARQLQALGRAPSRTEVDLRATLGALEPALRALAPPDVELRVGAPAGPLRVVLDPRQLEQVMVGLVRNAVEALPRGGHVDVRLEARGPTAVLTVQDDGPGFASGSAADAFEPFFTTKSVAEHAGLGLTVARVAIAAAGGRIDLASAPGGGARVEIQLPVVVDKTRAVSVGSSVRVLYCEDEEMVRQTTLRSLTRAGLEVTPTENPRAALERLEAEPRGFDLLLTDLMMPEMNGRELAARAQALVPELPVVFVSGYATEILGELGPNEVFLEKPYRASDLVAKIRRLLGRPSQGGVAEPPSAEDALEPPGTDGVTGLR